MAKPRKHEDDPAEEAGHWPAVYGMNVLVEICADPQEEVVHCPKGCNMVYGHVISAGDGFDPDANRFRPMPAAGSLVAFEEGMENVEGHFFYAGGREFRVVHVDAVIVAFPPGQ